jgi:ADP-dependent NAD(P)H-hydrate dehydratase / NAD(P)H-hydrate epimerase
MKILNAEQIRRLDAYTIENEPVKPIDLMERAAKTCFLWIKSRMRKKKKIHIFCGMGNNGGDGLAIGRMLGGSGHQVIVHIVNHVKEGSPDFLANRKRLNGVRNLVVNELEENASLPSIEKSDLVVDAMFGSGLNRPLQGYLSRIVQHINASGAIVVSVDIPSGLFCDDNSANDYRSVIRADYTLSFHLPKLSFLLPENEMFVGQWEILDIGLHREGLSLAETNYFIVEPGDLKAFYRPRKRFSHKGDFGHALLLAGSYGKMGAALIAAKACLRNGAGLLSVCIPSSGLTAMQVYLPEAMCLPLDNPEILDRIPGLQGFNAIAAGPGIGTSDSTARAMKLLIQEASVPLVLDADALNILAENPTWCGFLPPGSVLTPHPGEFDRLAGKSGSGYDRLMKAQEFAHRHQVHIVLKGAFSATITPNGRVFFNPTGNPGLAAGGSGDALTGSILAWMAQRYSTLESCLAAVYIHGLAADLAVRGKAHEGLIIGDAIDMIPKAIHRCLLSI